MEEGTNVSAFVWTALKIVKKILATPSPTLLPQAFCPSILLAEQPGPILWMNIRLFPSPACDFQWFLRGRSVSSPRGARTSRIQLLPLQLHPPFLPFCPSQLKPRPAGSPGICCSPSTEILPHIFLLDVPSQSASSTNATFSERPSWPSCSNTL